MKRRWRGLLALAGVLFGVGCANPGDPCGRDLDRAHGAICEPQPQSLEMIWQSAVSYNHAIALIVTCGPSMVGDPSLIPSTAVPLMGVFLATCVDEGACSVDDTLGYAVPSGIVLRARMGVQYYATEDGARHSEANEYAPLTGPECLWAAQRYPTGRAFVIVAGRDGVYSLIHAATVDADGMVSGAGTNDPTPLPLDTFRAL
ncbi:MAG: hypothetical protein KF729_10770 [Sandaracinaceae bacterium]|nr:hypothetical protein [Sandaracinaceae bacterium]